MSREPIDRRTDENRDGLLEAARDAVWWIADAHGPTALATAVLLGAALDALHRTVPGCGPVVRVHLATVARRWTRDPRIARGLALAPRARRDDPSPLILVVGDPSRASVHRGLRADEMVPVVHLPSLVAALESTSPSRCDAVLTLAPTLAHHVPNVSWYGSVGASAGRLEDAAVRALADLSGRAAQALSRCARRGGDDCRVRL